MKRIGSFIAGLLVGTMLFGGSVAYAAGVVAELSSHRFFVDGQEVKMTAYAINGNNYVMLRDIGKAVGFNVHWDSTNGCVQIESDKPYTGTAPTKTQSVAVGAKKADYTQADVMPEPKAGDKIPCSDGYVYEITDVSKYQNSMFATQETDTLPDPTCDWSLLDQPTLPEPEANHFTLLDEAWARSTCPRTSGGCTTSPSPGWAVWRSSPALWPASCCSWISD